VSSRHTLPRATCAGGAWRFGLRTRRNQFCAATDALLEGHSSRAASHTGFPHFRARLLSAALWGPTKAASSRAGDDVFPDTGPSPRGGAGKGN